MRPSQTPDFVVTQIAQRFAAYRDSNEELMNTNGVHRGCLMRGTRHGSETDFKVDSADYCHRLDRTFSSYPFELSELQHVKSVDVAVTSL